MKGLLLIRGALQSIIYLEAAIKNSLEQKAISILEMRDQFKSFHGKIIKVQF